MTPSVAEETAAAPLHLRIQPPRTLTSSEELSFFRAALARNPQSDNLRYALAEQLLLADLFDELIEVLRAKPIDQYRFLMLEVEARISRELPEENLTARDLCLRALDLAQDHEEKAATLAALAKIYARLGHTAQALAFAEDALALDTTEKNAFKRAAALELKNGTPENVLALVERTFAQGVFHSRVISARALAFATMGRLDQARETLGEQHFSRSFHPAPPDGWPTLQAFTHDLAEELATHPGMRYNRYGTASAHTWRIDEPSLQRSRVFPALQRMIAREVQTYIDQLPAQDHPFLDGRPKHAMLRNWCVITEGDGHETWHVHQNGWLSGVFYAFVPDHIALGAGKEGCIAFGLPEDIIGEENARLFGETIVRPQTGLMMLFPSHVFHRTYPHHGTGRRICCAFDIVPAIMPANDTPNSRA